jgi:hypothetical protein
MAYDSDMVIVKADLNRMVSGFVDPEFELSKKYPTVGYLTKPVNFTVTVMEPMDISEHFKEFWGTYGKFIGIFAGGFTGAYARVCCSIEEKRNKRRVSKRKGFHSLLQFIYSFVPR